MCSKVRFLFLKLHACAGTHIHTLVVLVVYFSSFLFCCFSKILYYSIILYLHIIYFDHVHSQVPSHYCFRLAPCQLMDGWIMKLSYV